MQRCAALFVVFCAIAQIGLQVAAAGGASHCCCAANAGASCPLKAKSSGCAMKSCSDHAPQSAMTIANDAPALLARTQSHAPRIDVQPFAIAGHDRARTLSVVPEPPPPKRA